jgi:transketolase
MRPAFIRTLVELCRSDDRIHLLVGDLGFGLIEAYAREFPDRLLNVGVAEQNLAGIAAGMAMCGKIVFTYSIANFPTLRAVEQIRNDICHHNASVKIVSVGCGLNYGALGVTHHATEDVAIMRTLPAMTVVAPGDPVETILATRSLAEQPGPAYLRLGKAGEPFVHATDSINFRLGTAIKVRDGDDLTLIASGTMLYNAVQASDLLHREGIHARVLSMHTIKPLDEQAVLAAAKETGCIVTLEEHSILGGLGSAVAELLADSCESQVAFKRLGIPNVFSREIGNQDHLKSFYCLDVNGILNAVNTILDTRRVRA